MIMMMILLLLVILLIILVKMEGWPMPSFHNDDRCIYKCNILKYPLQGGEEGAKEEASSSGEENTFQF